MEGQSKNIWIFIKNTQFESKSLENELVISDKSNFELVNANSKKQL